MTIGSLSAKADTRRLRPRAEQFIATALLVCALSTNTMLTEPQTQTLQAAADRIIPADDYPSAWDAGAGEFFRRLFAREPRFLPVYQAGLEALEAEALQEAGASFAALDTDRQDALLRRFEAAKGSAAFFRLLVEQTLEGYYADPGSGGNLNGIGWEMIGYRVTA